MGTSRNKVLAMYAALWLAVLVLGSGSLMALRQWGWARVESEHVDLRLADARATFESRDVIQAQKALVDLLAGEPERIPLAFDVFRTDLLAMPEVVAMVGEAHLQESQPALAESTLLLQDADSALKQLDQNASGNREAELWQARLSLQRGSFDDAIKLFDAYWEGHDEERRALADRFTPPKAELPARAAIGADALFRFGLWKEAATVADAGIEAGAKDPGLGFYGAVAAERSGDRASAIMQYERVLERLPNHALALARLLALEPEN